MGDTRGVRLGKYYQNVGEVGDTRGIRPGKYYQDKGGGHSCFIFPVASDPIRVQSHAW